VPRGDGARESADDVLAGFRKQHGDDLAGRGMVLHDCPRLPTGIFALDLAIGGGIPLTRATLVHGAESSGKSNLVLQILRSAQLRYPDKTAVLVEPEGTLVRSWAEANGVDWDRLIVVRPEYGEQAVDAVSGFLGAEDVSVVALDSVAALIASRQIEKSADQEAPGVAARLTSELVRKAIHALVSARNAGRAPGLVLVNQHRFKIGVMFGNPETIPGGEAQKFLASLRLRLYGKNVIDKRYSAVMPIAKKTTATLKKWKQPAAFESCGYTMATSPAGGFRPGEAMDQWKAARRYLAEYDLMKKTKDGYEVAGETFRTQDHVDAKMRSDPAFYDAVLGLVLGEVLGAENGAGEAEEGSTADRDDARDGGGTR